MSSSLIRGKCIIGRVVENDRAKVILVALMVFWLHTALMQTNEFHWTGLVLPASVIAIAIAAAVRIMRLNHWRALRAGRNWLRILLIEARIRG